MVRLVFRPYTQLGRSICTSEPLRTSARVSPGFVLAGHSSPSFGSYRARFESASLAALGGGYLLGAPGLLQRAALGRAPPGYAPELPPVSPGPVVSSLALSAHFHCASGFSTCSR